LFVFSYLYALGPSRNPLKTKGLRLEDVINKDLRAFFALVLMQPAEFLFSGADRDSFPALNVAQRREIKCKDRDQGSENRD
jgi:hypothetical protein